MEMGFKLNKIYTTFEKHESFFESTKKRSSNRKFDIYQIRSGADTEEKLYKNVKDFSYRPNEFKNAKNFIFTFSFEEKAETKTLNLIYWEGKSKFKITEENSSKIIHFYQDEKDYGYEYKFVIH
jgi:hypothetical protein